MAERFPYEDIINLSPHISKKYPQASMSDRAARFSPFAAITGYEDMVNEEARVTEERIELDESVKRVLDERLNRLRLSMKEEPIVTILHFVKDEKKLGGAYVSTTGMVKSIDEYHRTLILTNVPSIRIEDIYEIELH